MIFFEIRNAKLISCVTYDARLFYMIKIHWKNIMWISDNLVSWRTNENDCWHSGRKTHLHIAPGSRLTNFNTEHTLATGRKRRVDIMMRSTKRHVTKTTVASRYRERNDILAQHAHGKARQKGAFADTSDMKENCVHKESWETSRIRMQVVLTSIWRVNYTGGASSDWEGRSTYLLARGILDQS